VEWIVSSGSDIVKDANQLRARSVFIRRVAGADVSRWQQISEEFFHCKSNDTLNGVFITAHINDVMKLGTVKWIYSSDFVVANTCVWSAMADKALLRNMRRYNGQIELFFASQDISMDNEKMLHRSTTVSEIGSTGNGETPERKNYTRVY